MVLDAFLEEGDGEHNAHGQPRGVGAHGRDLIHQRQDRHECKEVDRGPAVLLEQALSSACAGRSDAA
eukprot:scaffold2707_cov417-Prasinococcus_capsulatus_cf.AAC.6